jgi:hypothetical protein
LNQVKEPVSGLRRAGKLMVIAASALLVFSSTAQSIPVDLSDNDAFIFGNDFVKWGYFPNDTVYDHCVADSDAFYPEDGFLKDHDDAFDGGPAFIIEGNEFFDSDHSANLTQNSITAGPESLSGLRVTVTHRAFTKKPILRSLIRMRNNSATPKDRTVIVDQASGGDDDGAIRDSSDGDAVVEANDRWVVWSDDPTTPEDAVLASAFYGKQNPREKVVQVTCDPSEPDDPLAVSYSIRVPAKSTRYLIVFSRLAPTNEAGIQGAAIYDQNTPLLFSGMTDQQKARVLNWDL